MDGWLAGWMAGWLVGWRANGKWHKHPCCHACLLFDHPAFHLPAHPLLTSAPAPPHPPARFARTLADMSRVQQASLQLMSELRIDQPSCEQIADRCGFAIPYTIHLLRALGAGAKQSRTGLAAASEEQEGPLASQPVSGEATRVSCCWLAGWAAGWLARWLARWLASPSKP